MKSEGMPRRTFLKLGASLGAASMIPGIAKSAERRPDTKTPDKKIVEDDRPKVELLGIVLDKEKNELQLSESELRELGDMNPKYESWESRNRPRDDATFTQAEQERFFNLCGKFQKYKQTLEVLADEYTKASNYKGKNPAQEDLDSLRAKARELGYEHVFFDQH